MMTRRQKGCVLAALCFAMQVFPAGAAETVAKSEGTRLLTSVPVEWNGDFSPWSAAAKGDLLFLSSSDSGRALSGQEPLRPGGFVTYRLTDRAPFARQIASFACPASPRDGDISIWRDYVLQAADPVDPLNQATQDIEGCGGTQPLSVGGLRIVDISDPRQPTQVGFAELVCGARNHTVIPHGSSAYIYALKDACPQTASSLDPGSVRLRVLKVEESKRGVTVVPASQKSLRPHVECYDWSVHLRHNLAACYGRSRISLFDISDPPNPKVLGTFLASDRTFQGATFTGDGRYLAAATVEVEGERCTGADDERGVVLIYEVEEMLALGAGPDSLTTIEPLSTYAIPRTSELTERGSHSTCGPTSVTLLPTRDRRRYLAAVGWNTGGMSIFDFTQPSSPEEVAFLVTRFGSADSPDEVNSFSGIRRAIWHGGRIYAPELMDRLGLRVIETDALNDIPMSSSNEPYNPQTISR